MRLAEVTALNWRDVVALELEPHQRDFVASNVYSLAEASFTPQARPRAIYADDRLVGFLMYEPLSTYGEPDYVSIYRFMIDRRHQRKGVGRAALAQALDEIRALPEVTTVSVCYVEANPAKPLYADFGFVEVGRDRAGEILAELSIRPPAP